MFNLKTEEGKEQAKIILRRLKEESKNASDEINREKKRNEE